MFCTQCGNANRDTAKFCVKCGAELGHHAPKAEVVPAIPQNPAPTAGLATPSGNTRTGPWLGAMVVISLAALAATWLYTRNKPVPIQPPAAARQAPPSRTTPDSLPPAPGMQAAPAALNETEVRRLVARLQQEPPPSSCQSAVLKIRQEASVPARQANDIARRTYPELCNSEANTMPTTVRIDGKTIDQIYEERVAAECARGITGFFCREGIHNKLCNGHWSENPPTGQKRCYRVENQN